MSARVRRSAARALVISLLACTTLVATGPDVGSAATRPIAFRITMGACPKGLASDLARLRVEWLDGDGVRKDSGTTTVNAGGSWTFCRGTAADPSPEVAG